MHFFKRKHSNGAKGKYWWFTFTLHGIRIQESSKLANRRDAETYAASYRKRLVEEGVGIIRRKPAPTFEQAIADYLAEVEVEHADHPRTYQRYLAASRPLLKFFGVTNIGQITLADVEKYKAQRMRLVSQRTGRKLKPATINQELVILKAIFKAQVRRETIHKDPSAGVSLLTLNNQKTRVLSPAEEAAYLAVASQPLHDLVTIMLETGFRFDEASRITRENVNLKEGCVFNPFGKSKAARRRVPLSVRASDVLRDRMIETEGRYLFAGEGKSDEQAARPEAQHSVALKESGVAHFTFHCCRHTFATRAVEAGVDMATLASLLGHSTLSMVMRYAHPSQGHQADAIRKMESAREAKAGAV